MAAGNYFVQLQRWYRWPVDVLASCSSNKPRSLGSLRCPIPAIVESDHHILRGVATIRYGVVSNGEERPIGEDVVMDRDGIACYIKRVRGIKSISYPLDIRGDVASRIVDLRCSRRSGS